MLLRYRRNRKEASQLELLGTYLHEEAQNESTIIDGEGIIIDASMHELRCLHTIRHIRGKDPDIPIVVVSSRSGDTRLVDVQDIRRTGATAVLRISRMEEAELIDAVVAALGESRC